MTMSTPSTPTKQFRLLVADIDGTLVTSSREITPRVLDAVGAAQRKRVRVCLATGRIWPSAEPYFRRLGADPPAVLYNGGLVYDFRTDTVLRRVPLDYHQAKLVLELLREFPAVQPFLYVGDRVYTTRTILSMGGRPDLLAVRDRIARLPISINSVFSEDTCLEILPQGSSKGAALEFVAQHLGIPLSEIIAVGDNLNDLEMIRTAGLGVAMGNAPPELRAQAGYVTSTNDEGGLAEVIERFILNRTASA